MADQEQNDAAQDQDPAQELETAQSDVGQGGVEDFGTYEPSRVEVNRSRIQGGGIGQSDFDKQRDPTRYPSADQYGRDTGGADDGGR